MWRLLAIVIAVGLCFVPALTSAQPHGAPKALATVRIPPPVRTLRLAMPDASVSVDPSEVADENNVQLANLLYSGLVALDSQYRVVPAAAARYTISPDRRAYTFYLRKNLRFSNGDAVTAQDFRYSITRSLNPALKSPSAPTYLLNIKGAESYLTGKAKAVSGIEVLGTRTLRITARWPVPYFLMELTYPTSFVLDAKRIQKLGRVDNTLWYSDPIGCGPYRLKSWVPNTKMVLVPNKFYWGVRPAFKQIVISFSPLPPSDVYQYVTHNLDIVALQSSDLAGPPQAGMFEAQMLAIDGIYMNMRSKPFNNRHMRLALTLALDRARIVPSTMGDGVTFFPGYVPPGEAGYYPTLHPLPYDAARARTELRLAGYSATKKPPAIALSYADDPSLARLVMAVAQAWHKNLGLTVDTQALTLNTLEARVQSNSLPLYLLGWTADYPDPHDWLSHQWRSDALDNEVHYRSTKFDRLVETADVTWDPAKRMQAYNSAQDVLTADAAWIPLYIPHRLGYIRPGINNVYLTGYGIIPRDGNWAEVGFHPLAPKHHRVQ